IVPIPYHLEADWEEHVPAECRGAGNGFAIAERARGNDATDRAVRPLRGSSDRHHLKEFNKRAVDRRCSHGRSSVRATPLNAKEWPMGSPWPLPVEVDRRASYRPNTGAPSPSCTLPWLWVAASRTTFSPERMVRGMNTGAPSPSCTLPWLWVAASRSTLSPQRTGRPFTISFMVCSCWRESPSSPIPNKLKVPEPNTIGFQSWDASREVLGPAGGVWDESDWRRNTFGCFASGASPRMKAIRATSVVGIDGHPLISGAASSPSCEARPGATIFCTSRASAEAFRAVRIDACVA